MSYNDDFDMAHICDINRAQMFLDGLEMQIVQNYAKCIFNRQMAGFVKRYQDLTFTTIRGAGHMAPTDKPLSLSLLRVIEELIIKSKLN